MSALDQAVAGFSSSVFDARLRGAAYLEILLLGAVLPLLVLWFAGARLEQFIIPWLVFIPLFLGLRFGFTGGAAGALLPALVFAGVVYFEPQLLREFPRAEAIVLLLAGIGAGEFRDFWASRLRRLNALCRYHQARLEQFTRSYRVLQASHAQLERQLAGGATSLRTLLQRLKEQQALVKSDSDAPLGGMAEWVLQVMVEAGSLHAAAVHVVTERGVLQSPPVVVLGCEPELSRFNPLLRETLRSGALSSVRSTNATTAANVIAVVPLVDSVGHIHGVVSVNEMPFIGVNQHTFDLLAVLGGYLGDILSSHTRPMRQMQGRWSLRACLQRNLEDVRRSALPAALVACRIADTPSRDALVTLYCGASRALDQSWVARDRTGHPVTVRILPLTDHDGVHSYLHRLQQQVRELHGAEGMHSHILLLDAKYSADEVMAELCAICDIDALDASPEQHFHQIPEAAP